MQIRRLITGVNTQGKAIVSSDTQIEGIQLAIAPGAIFHTLWGDDQPPVLPNDGSPPDTHTYFPKPGGYRFTLFTLPPDSTAQPPDFTSMSQAQIEAAMAAGIEEAETRLPGLFVVMEPDNPGFHTTDTVDLVYVVSGQVTLVLDDDEIVTLNAGNTVVQNGTRHAWRNPGDQPATLLAVSLGATRQ